MAYQRALVERTLGEARTCVNEQIEALLARNRQTGYGPLYDLLADYPFREGKGLRPAICLSAARAARGHTDQAACSAAALELFHNAFLLHDDVEDASDFRRGRITMLKHRGAPVAVNVGDATNVMAVQLLLDNTRHIGVHKALLVFSEVERMARESVEGQAIELAWIGEHEFDLADRDYVRMAHKKTCWYTVIAPLRVGVLCGAPPGANFPVDANLAPLIQIGHFAGIAFQISDDLLNLEAVPRYTEKSQTATSGKASAQLCSCIFCAWRPSASAAGHWRCCGSTAVTKPRPRWRGCAKRWKTGAPSSTGAGWPGNIASERWPLTASH